MNVGILVDSDNTRRNFAEKLLKDFEDLAAMQGKKVNLIE